MRTVRIIKGGKLERYLPRRTSARRENWLRCMARQARVIESLVMRALCGTGEAARVPKWDATESRREGRAVGGSW